MIAPLSINKPRVVLIELRADVFWEAKYRISLNVVGF